MNKITKWLTVFFSSILMFMTCNAFSLEQECNGSTTTTSDDEFTISEVNSALIVHSESELMWSRCVVGQTWNETDEICEGDAVRLTWQNALQLSNDFVLAEYTDWRVPNLKELASIVERACVSPAANLTIFSNTPDGNFWTSTPNTSADKVIESWSVDFSVGRIESREKQQDYYIRMVRYAD